jgi:hypothetical protein
MLAYVGPDAPVSITQFEEVSTKSALVANWRSFQYMSAQEATGGQVYVALGWSGSDASIGVDCVDITIVPLQSAQSVMLDTARSGTQERGALMSWVRAGPYAA